MPEREMSRSRVKRVPSVWTIPCKAITEVGFLEVYGGIIIRFIELIVWIVVPCDFWTCIKGKVEIENADPDWTLLWYIRNKLLLTGSKLSCGQGACGACTVMLSEVDRTSGQVRHYTVNACIFPIGHAHGKSFTTVEGIGSTRTVLHPVQERLAKCHGTQCGFCSPGMVMSMYTLLRNTTKPTVEQIEYAIEGNICRCTGYRPILESFKTFTNDNSCPLGEQCCKNVTNGNNSNNNDIKQSCDMPGSDKDMTSGKWLYDVSTFKSHDSSQEFIFPSELQLTDIYDKASIMYSNATCQWFRPATLEEALHLMASVPDCQWLMGNIHVGVNKPLGKLKKCVTNVITVGHLQELQVVDLDSDYLHIGAGTTLACLEQCLVTGSLVDKAKQAGCHLLFEALLTTFRHWKSGVQIKNVSSIGGNIMRASRTSNFLPMLMLLRAEAVFITEEGKEKIVQIDTEFTKNIPRTDRRHLLKAVRIPVNDLHDKYIGLYYATQQTHPHGRSSVVSGALQARVSPHGVLYHISAAFGGLLEHQVIYEKDTDRKLWEETLIYEFKEWFLRLHKPDNGNKSYEQQVSVNFFTMFYYDVRRHMDQGLKAGIVSPPDNVSTLMESVRVWEPQSDRKSVGQPFPHQWALEHATGEAKYIMDLPQHTNELHMALVTSTKAHARVLSIDASKALKLPGVVDFISHKDIPGVNKMGEGLTEEVFVQEEATCVGHILGAVLAETSVAAAAAVRAVVVDYEELPAILTIQQALKQKSFLGPSKELNNGDIIKGFGEAEHVIQGEIEVGGQDHYYLETQCAVVLPKEGAQEYDVYSSTQNTMLIQSNISAALGVPLHKINVHVRRIGGGFGGKELRSVMTAVPAAIGAHKHNRPVRLSMDRFLDMTSSGGRHPCHAKYNIGFDKDGKILALSCEMSMDGGNTPDVTDPVLWKGMLYVANSYHIPNMKLTGHQLKTNLASNTAFRGFGRPQGNMVIHACMEHVAKYLNKDVKQGAALVNIYLDGSVLIHHGGIEMGQGLNTKIIQIASECLGVDYSTVTISEASTYTVPNALQSAASVSTDLFGGAVKNACDKLNESLQPIKDKNPSSTWKEWVTTAFTEKTNLSATGFYSPGDPRYDPIPPDSPKVPRYFTYGTACTEVQLDVLTGEHKLLRTDIIIDIGKSINPAVDIGQIEGGFLQGYSYYCLEEVQRTPDGHLITYGPSKYRVPIIRDISPKFNVTLLKDHPNVKAVYSSKGVGEPPLLLGSSAYLAIKDAITSVRLDKGLPGYHRLDCPASPKRVLQACGF